MKEGLHPNYYQATVTCNCGNTFTVGSTKKEIHVEICSKCHRSTQASRRLPRLADVSRDSTRNTIWASNKGQKESIGDGRHAVPFFISS